MKAGAVSEVIGAILLISLSVLAMGIVILAFFSGPLPTSVPSFSGLVTNSSKTVYITHEGGDTISVGKFKILVDGVDETRNFTKSITGNFSVGQVMNATLPNWPRRLVMISNSSWGGETVLLSADLFGMMAFTPPGWYDGAWLYRKKITILGSQVTGSVNDFPVLIYTGADPDLRTKALNSGDDLLFTSWDGTTKLPHEIDNYTGTQSGSLTAWVKVPALNSGTDTIIYLYYSNAGASNQQNVEAVWTNGYAGVWHLNGSLIDSTSNSNDGINQGTTDVAGKIARARNLASASSQYIDIPSPGPSLNITGALTVSAWINAASWRNPYYLGTIYDKGSWPTTTTGYVLRAGSSGGNGIASFLFGNGTAAWSEIISGAVMSTGTWYNLAGSFDGTYQKLYLNGAQVNSSLKAWSIANSLFSPQIGDCQFTRVNGQDARYFNGIIDEVRVSTDARSSDWIATEYTNQNNPGAFISISTQQDPLTMT